MESQRNKSLFLRVRKMPSCVLQIEKGARDRWRWYLWRTGQSLVMQAQSGSSRRGQWLYADPSGTGSTLLCNGPVNGFETAVEATAAARELFPHPRWWE